MGRRQHQRRRLSPHICQNVESREAFAAKLQHDRYEGLYLYLDPRRGEITLRTYATDWLERQVISDSTYRNYCDRMKMVKHLFQTAVEERRRQDDPTDGIKLPRSAAHAVDEDEIPTLHEVDVIAKQISPQYRLTVYLQAGAGLRISETLAFTTDCRRTDFLRVRRQVSSKAHRDDCTTRFIPLKHRAAGEYRDVPLPAFLADEIDTHLREWGTKTADGMEVLFAPRERGKGTMPTATTYAYHFGKALKTAGIVHHGHPGLGQRHHPRLRPGPVRLDGQRHLLEAVRFDQRLRLRTDVHLHLHRQRRAHTGEPVPGVQHDSSAALHFRRSGHVFLACTSQSGRIRVDFGPPATLFSAGWRHAQRLFNYLWC